MKTPAIALLLAAACAPLTAYNPYYTESFPGPGVGYNTNAWTKMASFRRPVEA